MQQFCFYMDWSGLQPEAWAAWVQAVGSVVAIFVAVLVPRSLQKRDRERLAEERLARAKSYALVILPLAEQLALRIKTAKFNLETAFEDDSFRSISSDLEISAGITDRLAEIHELGAAGSELADGLAALSKARSLIEEHDFYVTHRAHLDPETGVEEPIPEPSSYRPDLEKSRACIEKSIMTMRSFFG